MKLITVGTSCGFPKLGRTCECNCLEVNGSVYFFDAGIDLGVATVNLGYEFEAVKAVFVSHTHSDHIVGVAPFVNLCCWFAKNASTAFYLPSTECIGYAKSIAINIDKTPINPKLTFNTFVNGVIYRDENITVTAFHSGHIEKAHSFLVEAEGKKILFTGDLDREMKSLTNTAFNKPHDIIVTECAHFPEEVVLETFPKFNTKRLLITHIGRTVPVERLEQLIAEGKIFGEICEDYGTYEL